MRGERLSSRGETTDGGEGLSGKGETEMKDTNRKKGVIRPQMEKKEVVK